MRGLNYLIKRTPTPTLLKEHDRRRMLTLAATKTEPEENLEVQGVSKFLNIKGLRRAARKYSKQDTGNQIQSGEVRAGVD